MPNAPVPEGYHSVIPYLVVADVPVMLSFLERAFGGEVIERVEDGTGAVRHAEVRIAGTVVMLGQARGDHAPERTTLYHYVPDADAAFARAVGAGAEVIQPVADQFYGDRCGGVRDPAGNGWWVARRVKTLSKEELDRAAKERK